MVRTFILGFALAVTLPAVAQAFERISDRTQFISLVGDKELRIPLFGIRLNVTPDGMIDGRASGWELSGTWSWQDGYFCREIDWSGYPIEYNCQLVEVDGDRVRFTVDQGAGDDAVFRIR